MLANCSVLNETVTEHLSSFLTMISRSRRKVNKTNDCPEGSSWRNKTVYTSANKSHNYAQLTLTSQITLFHTLRTNLIKYFTRTLDKTSNKRKQKTRHSVSTWDVLEHGVLEERCCWHIQQVMMSSCRDRLLWRHQSRRQFQYLTVIRERPHLVREKYY